MDGFFIFLAIGMVTTGSLNTLSTKLADVTSAYGIRGDDVEFNHPFFQALTMFLGEFLCLCAFYILRSRARKSSDEKALAALTADPGFKPHILMLPALCDMSATSIMYLGLTMTYASVFQMLRGSVVIFTGILSVIFLKRRLYAFHWIGMALVLIGLAVVGLSSVIGGSDDSNAPNAVLGDILVVCAQVIVSVQMVIEEKFIGGYNVPALQCVGLEGAFGFVFTSFLLVILYFIPGSSAGNHAENTPDAFVMLYNSWLITLATCGNIMSISFFNFFGISVTKHVNATTRMVLDSIRTFIIWGLYKTKRGSSSDSHCR